MRPARAAAFLSALIAGAGSGCDWRDFSKLEGQTPVLVVSPPSGYPAQNDFGGALRPVEPPKDGSTAARFVVSSVNQAALAIVDLDRGGHPAATSVTGSALDGLNGFPVTGIAEVPGAGKALLGSPQSLGGTLLLLDLAPPFAVSPFFSSASEPELGVGVAAGALGGGAAPDLVAVSSTSLHVFVDGQTAAPHVYYTATGSDDPCPLFLSEGLPNRVRNNRPIVVAPLLAGGNVQVAVGTPVTVGGGSVSIFDVDVATGKASCSLTLHGTSGADQRFGQALAVGDFDGDGRADLLVGEPPQTVYLFRGPVTGTPTAALTDAAGIDFGAALAALPLDAHQGDEALIGDPDATVSGATLAGRVTIRTGAALATALMPTMIASQLTPRAPQANDGYGSVVAALPFCGTSAGTGCTRSLLPLVGAAASVYTYFTLRPPDPRAP